MEVHGLSEATEGPITAPSRGWRLTTSITLIGLAISVALFIWLWRAGDEEAERRLETQLTSVAASADETFTLVADHLDALSGLFRASVIVTRDEFHVFANEIGLVPGMSGIGYLVEVERDDLERFEAEMSQLHGRPLFVSGLSGPTDQDTAAGPTEHFPLLFISPEEAWREHVGVDMAANPEVGPSIESALQTGDLTMSAFFDLSQQAAGEGAIMLKAVGRPHSADTDVLVGALLDFGALLEAGLPPGVVPHVTLDFAEGATSEAPDEGSASTVVAYGGREWTVTASPADGSPFAPDRIGAYTVLGMGILASVLAGIAALMGRQRLQAATALAAARQTTEAKNRFIASISHELRTPLTAVLGYTQILQDAEDLTSEERIAMMGIITWEASDLAYLIDDLLVAARSEIGQISIAHEAVDLRKETERVVEASRMKNPIEVEPPVGDHETAEGDGARIRQILRNLIDNARRHGGDRVQIVIRTEGPHVRLEVRDDGPPIPIEIQERLFQRYQHFGEPRDITETLGLGLSVSSDLAQMMGGTLRYDRRDGWSVFSLLLPLAASARDPGPAVGVLH